MLSKLEEHTIHGPFYILFMIRRIFLAFNLIFGHSKAQNELLCYEPIVSIFVWCPLGSHSITIYVYVANKENHK